MSNITNGGNNNDDDDEDEEEDEDNKFGATSSNPVGFSTTNDDDDDEDDSQAVFDRIMLKHTSNDDSDEEDDEEGEDKGKEIDSGIYSSRRNDAPPTLQLFVRQDTPRFGFENTKQIVAPLIAEQSEYHAQFFWKVEEASAIDELLADYE